MKGKYRILYKRSAGRELQKLPREQLRLVVKRIEQLASDPFPEGSVKLRGSERLYRVRQGDYRIIYQVNGSELIIVVIKIGHRREVYRPD